MSTPITLKGSLDIGGDNCGSSCNGGVDRCLVSLAFRCSPEFFQSVVGPSEVRVATAGVIGAAFVDLDLLNDLAAIDMLYLDSDQPVIARIGAEAAFLDGVGATFATIINAETLTFTLDGTAITVAFVVPGDTTAAAVAARINAACALAGLATPRATVLSSGQIRIQGILTGPQGVLTITGGTAAAKVGYTAAQTDVGAGSDIRFFGIMGPIRFDPSAAPARVQLSGSANVKVVAAGRTTA